MNLLVKQDAYAIHVFDRACNYVISIGIDHREGKKRLAEYLAQVEKFFKMMDE